MQNPDEVDQIADQYARSNGDQGQVGGTLDGDNLITTLAPGEDKWMSLIGQLNRTATDFREVWTAAGGGTGPFSLQK